MNNLIKKTELLANICIIIVAVLLGIVVVKKYLAPIQTDRSASAHQLTNGAKILLPGTDWGGNRRTLLVVLQKGCRFCTESAPFYQRLTHVAATKNVKLIAVFPHDVTSGQQYLSELNVQIGEIKQAPLGSLQVKGTPTLILVDDKGEVADSWVGKLSPEKESEVLDRM